MPVNVSLMDALKKRYGKRGEGVYYGMESKGSKGFRKGVKTASKEGHTAADLKSYRTRKRTARKGR